MANLPAKTIAQFVSDFAAAAQASSSTLLDFTTGSIYLALAEASADEAAFLQGLIAYVMTLRWLSTSFGADCDSWVNDWGLKRLPAISATGLATFSRITPTVQAVVPVGATVASADGTQQFTVYADPTNSAYSATLGGYLIAAGISSVNAPVIAVTPGIGGNLASGTLTLLQTSISYVDAVTNGAPFTNGLNAETDAALRIRFVAFINQLAKGTDAAITFAIQSIQQGLQVAVHDNVDPGGVTDLGMVTVYVDDGSGAPPAALITAANNAMPATRAAGIRTGVFAATTLVASVVMTIQTSPGFSHPVVVGQVGTAVQNYINGIGLEQTLYFTELSHQAYLIPGVFNVTSITLNGGTADLVPAAGQTIKTTSVIVS